LVVFVEEKNVDRIQNGRKNFFGISGRSLHARLKEHLDGGHHMLSPDLSLRHIMVMLNLLSL
jgi:hypothetical protein